MLRKSRQNRKIIERWLTICLLCCMSLDCLVNCQLVRESQQQSEKQSHDSLQDSVHKYKQLQYQMQQQQQLQYQQQMQQQQKYFLQQQKQQEQFLQPISLPLQQQQQQQEQQQQYQQQQQIYENPSDNGIVHPPPTQSQLLKTGASLVVAADNAPNLGQKEFYGDADMQQTASRRIMNMNGGRKRKRRPQANAENSEAIEDESKQYWRGHVEDEYTSSTPSYINSREDSPANTKIRRRKQPAIREPLAALEKEQKLYELRDKQRQEQSDDNNGGSENKNRDKSYRRPYSQAKKELENAATPAATATNSGGSKTSADLKNLLKNAGGLSLSEILQQKNLSLDDLLKGKQNALLALQTTAASPSHQPDSKNMKPSRRIPTSYLNGAASSEIEANSSAENTSSEENSSQGGKNRLKFPSLQRLKLFGTSSRSTAVPLPPGSDEILSKKREPNYGSTTTTSTTTTTTTTRIPLYKKRAQQRSTLKPPALIKMTSTTSDYTSEERPSKEASTSTKTTEDEETTKVDENSDQEVTDEANKEAELEGEEDEESTTTGNEVTDKTSGTTTPTTTTTTTTSTTISPITRATTTTTAATRSIASSTSRQRKFGSNNRVRSKSKFRERLNENNIKSNSIEFPYSKSTQTTLPNSKESRESTENLSAEEDDDLENFFDEALQKKKKDDEGKSDSSVERITQRLERYRISTQNPPTFPSSSSTSTSTEMSIPDFDGIDDRTDLLELIEDRRSGNSLFKVLQQRNMTLDQLIEHRKRGSSQLHLATIVEEKARSQFFPGQKVVLSDNMDIVTAFENFPHFNLLNLKSVKPDDIKTDSQGSSYFTSIIDIEPTDEAYKDASNGEDSSLRGPMYTQQTQRSNKAFRLFPSWKTLALASLATTKKGNPYFLPRPKLLLDDQYSQELSYEDNFAISNETTKDNSNDIQPEIQPKMSINTNLDAEHTVTVIENDLARAHDLLDLELSGHAFKRSPSAIAAASMIKQNNGAGFYANMPAGVRSAIIASAAIVLTSLGTFLIIFIVCRLKQRQNSQTNYLRTYNAMKSKMPMTPPKTMTTTTTTTTTARTTISTPTTPKLDMLSSSSAMNSRRSSFRNNALEDFVDDIGKVNGGGNELNNKGSQYGHVSTISTNQQFQQYRNDLLFPRHNSSGIGEKALHQQITKSCSKTSLCGRNRNSLEKASRSSYAGGNILINNVGYGGGGGCVVGGGGVSSATGSTSSLALSLRSAHNISSTKLNTMDPNSPEVQEYLFENLRKSFN